MEKTGLWVQTQDGVLVNLAYARRIFLRTDDHVSSIKSVRAEYEDAPAVTLFESKDADEVRRAYERVTQALVPNADLNLGAAK